MNPVRDASVDFWLYTRVFCLSVFIVAFALNWARKAQIAKSFKILGLLCMFVFFMMLITVAFVNELAYVFGPLFSVSLAAWAFLDSWYFYRYPGYSEWLHNPNRPPATFGLSTWLGKLLTAQETPDDSPQPTHVALLSWKTATIVLAILFVLGLAFGFSRGINHLAMIGRISQQKEQQTRQATRQAIDTATARTARQFSGQIQSLTAGQKQQATQLKSATEAILKRAEQNGQVAAGARQEAARAARAAAIAARRSNGFIILPSPVRLVPPIRIDPDKVRPLPAPTPQPTNRNRGKYGGIAAGDTSDYARLD